MEVSLATGESSRHRRWHMMLLLAASALLPPSISQCQTAVDARDATRFPGQSIVEQMQAAIRDCASNPCELYIAAGTYNSSPVSSWKNRDATGASVGVAIPSNVEIR